MSELLVAIVALGGCVLFYGIRQFKLEQKVEQIVTTVNKIVSVLEVASPALGKRLENEGTQVVIADQWIDDAEEELENV